MFALIYGQVEIGHSKVNKQDFLINVYVIQKKVYSVYVCFVANYLPVQFL